LNRGREARVAEQVEELRGLSGASNAFLAPQPAELIVSQDNEKILESHRREIVVVFCDLRGYTIFTKTTEPEEVLASTFCANTTAPWARSSPSSKGRSTSSRAMGSCTEHNRLTDANRVHSQSYTCSMWTAKEAHITRRGSQRGL